LVSYYYLHYSDDPLFSGSFVYYPHYRNAITCYADATFSDRGSRIIAGHKGAFHSVFSRNYHHCIHVEPKVPFRKLGIAFEPLGLNHFLQVPLSQIDPTQSMNSPCSSRNLKASCATCIQCHKPTTPQRSMLF
jgi:hypothetical protein